MTRITNTNQLTTSQQPSHTHTHTHTHTPYHVRISLIPEAQHGEHDARHGRRVLQRRAAVAVAVERPLHMRKKRGKKLRKGAFKFKRIMRITHPLQMRKKRGKKLRKGALKFKRKHHNAKEEGKDIEKGCI